MVFVGVDWAEAHHDICVLDESGQVVGKRRVPDGVEGIRRIHELVSAQGGEPEQVVVGIETDRGLLVGALLAAGYQVYAINPLSASRYRDRHVTSRAKSDPGDAKVLADLVRTDRHNHRQVAGDSELAEAVKVLARAHQDLIWSRQRFVNRLRSTLREFYPAALEAFGGDLDSAEALTLLERAPTPGQGRQLSQAKIVATLRKSGRKRNLESRAAQIQAALRAPNLQAPPRVSSAYGVIVKSMVAVVDDLNRELVGLEAELSQNFEGHPDAEIYRSLPGLGVILSARVLAEFGDDPNRFDHPKSRKAYAGTAPITKASGTRLVVLARVARNRRLADACYWWAFSSLSGSAGARRYYDILRGRGQTHHQALRALGNRWVGILHGCLRHRSPYSETVAWPTPLEVAA
ncbi:MAG TPA: IS110 family transposase [Candidatus Dormibacteraeota bacterium]